MEDVCTVLGQTITCWGRGDPVWIALSKFLAFCSLVAAALALCAKAPELLWQRRNRRKGNVPLNAPSRSPETASMRTSRLPAFTSIRKASKLRRQRLRAWRQRLSPDPQYWVSLAIQLAFISAAGTWLIDRLLRAQFDSTSVVGVLFFLVLLRLFSNSIAPAGINHFKLRIAPKRRRKGVELNDATYLHGSVPSLRINGVPTVRDYVLDLYPDRLRYQKTLVITPVAMIVFSYDPVVGVLLFLFANAVFALLYGWLNRARVLPQLSKGWPKSLDAYFVCAPQQIDVHVDDRKKIDQLIKKYRPESNSDERWLEAMVVAFNVDPSRAAASSAGFRPWMRRWLTLSTAFLRTAAPHITVWNPPARRQPANSAATQSIQMALSNAAVKNWLRPRPNNWKDLAALRLFMYWFSPIWITYLALILLLLALMAFESSLEEANAAMALVWPLISWYLLSLAFVFGQMRGALQKSWINERSAINPLPVQLGLDSKFLGKKPVTELLTAPKARRIVGIIHVVAIAVYLAVLNTYK